MNSSIIVPSRNSTGCSGYCSVFYQSCSRDTSPSIPPQQFNEPPSPSLLGTSSSACFESSSKLNEASSDCSRNSDLCVLNVKTRFKVDHSDGENSGRIFFIDNTNLHSVPRNCTGILVAFCSSHVPNGNEEQHKWRLGIILLHTIERTIIFETSAMKDSVSPPNSNTDDF